MKKIKGPFCSPSHPFIRPPVNSSNPSNPSHPSNSGWRPRRKVKHWTPKGDCKVTGNKERNPLQFYEENPFKNEQTQIIEN